MGGLRRSSPGIAEISRMRVHPDVQRRGFGQTILQTLEVRASELGFSALHLDTTIQQVAAQGLYVKNGYAEVGRARSGRSDIILYEKRLPTC